mgnify:CR=1 FL=1
MRIFSVSRFLSILLLFVAAALPARAETLVGSNIDSRVVVAIKTAPDGVQGWMPEGWTSVPFPAGPLQGANLLLVMIDGRLEMDAEGKPLSPPSRRAAALVGLARQDDGDAVRMFVLRVYTTAPDRDPYGNAMQAGIARESALTGPADGARESADFWRVVTDSGGQLALRLNYTTGRRGWTPGALFPHSAVNPEFSRIYRYEQMVDLVSSTAVGKPLTGEFKLTSTVLELAGIFDGSEEVIAVMDVPVYVRKVYLP